MLVHLPPHQQQLAPQGAPGAPSLFPLLPVIPRQTPGLPPSLPFRTTPPPKPAPISPPFPRFPQFPHRLSRPVEDREGCPALAGVRNLCLDDPSAGRPDRHCNFSDRSIQARRATAARSASPSSRPYRRHCSAPTSLQAQPPLISDLWTLPSCLALSGGGVVEVQAAAALAAADRGPAGRPEVGRAVAPVREDVLTDDAPALPRDPVVVEGRAEAQQRARPAPTGRANAF